MHRRSFWRSGIAFAGVILTANVAHALGFQLGQTKEQLKLDYQVSVTDHGTGRVTVNVAIADEGRLKPLNSVDLVVRSKDGTNFVDLSMKLARGSSMANWSRQPISERNGPRRRMMKTSSLDGRDGGA